MHLNVYFYKIDEQYFGLDFRTNSLSSIDCFN